MGIIRTQDSGKIWKLSFQQGDLPFSIRFHKGFRFISTLKAGCFRDLSTGIPLCFSVLKHTQSLGLLSGSVEILSFDLDVRHSVSRPPLLLLPRLLFFASTHLGSPRGSSWLLLCYVDRAEFDCLGRPTATAVGCCLQ